MSRLSAAAGFLLPYFGACGLASFLVRQPAPWRLFADGWTEPPACLPQRYMLGAIGAHCPFAPVNWFWALTLGLPRAADRVWRSSPGCSCWSISHFAWPRFPEGAAGCAMHMAALCRTALRPRHGAREAPLRMDDIIAAGLGACLILIMLAYAELCERI